MARFSLPSEVRNVAGLGEVVVRSLGFSERTAYDDRYIEALGDDVRKAIADGDKDVIADLLSARRIQFASMATYLLHLCVRDADGKALMSEAEWEAFGAKHRKPASELHGAAYRLSGLDVEEAEKKPETDPASGSALS